MGLLDKVKAAQGAAAGAYGGMAGGGDMAAQAAHAQLVNKLSHSGVPASGVIQTLRPMGETDISGGQRTELDVTITPDGGTAYQTTISQSFLPAQLQGLAPGGEIGVKYDPDNPSAAIIYNW